MESHGTLRGTRVYMPITFDRVYWLEVRHRMMLGRDSMKRKETDAHETDQSIIWEQAGQPVLVFEMNMNT
jgi:hypothetical protein